MLARLAAILVAVVMLATRADAQLTDIQIDRRVHAGVTAIDMNTTQETDAYDLPGRDEPGPLGGR